MRNEQAMVTHNLLVHSLEIPIFLSSKESTDNREMGIQMKQKENQTMEVQDPVTT